MPPPFTKHVFVCLNERPPGHPRGDCTSKGSPELLSKLKGALKARGLDETVVAPVFWQLDQGRGDLALGLAQLRPRLAADPGAEGDQGAGLFTIAKMLG